MIHGWLSQVPLTLHRNVALWQHCLDAHRCYRDLHGYIDDPDEVLLAHAHAHVLGCLVGFQPLSAVPEGQQRVLLIKDLLTVDLPTSEPCVSSDSLSVAFLARRTRTTIVQTYSSLHL